MEAHYLHGELETINNYDVCGYSPQMMSKLTMVGLHTGVYIPENIPVLVFVKFDYYRLKGIVVAIDDREALDYALEWYGRDIIMLENDKPAIREFYPETADLLKI